MGRQRRFHSAILFFFMFTFGSRWTLTGEDVFVSVFALVFRPLTLLSALLHLCLQLLESLQERERETETVLNSRLPVPVVFFVCFFNDIT